MADHIISYDCEGNMYLEDVPGMGMEDEELSDEDIFKKYGLETPKEA